jgi:hypothetical protein
VTVNVTPAAAAFYKARDQRTLEYGANPANLGAPISLTVTQECAATRAGQIATLALVDLLFRVHQNVRLDLPKAQVVAPRGEPVNANGLLDAALLIASGIDPFQNPLRDLEAGELVIAIEGRGTSTHADPDISVRWHGGRGEAHIRGQAPPPPEVDMPRTTNGHTDDVLGAAAAACLSAAAAFGLAHGATPRSTAVNILTRTEDAAANTQSLSGPVDVGDVQVIGGGAVGHALTYWLRCFEAIGTWWVIDGDDATLHNTNRCMGMTAADAGWPEGSPGGPVTKKAETAARNLGEPATVVPNWYHQIVDGLPRPDLTLVLANEYEVRSTVAQRGDELLIHATTGRDWTAELHRHIAAEDDCLSCRMPGGTKARLACSEGPVAPSDASSGDAALPFLSAMAGLLLATALLDLSHERAVLSGRVNHWRVALDLPTGPVFQTGIHRLSGCPHVLSPEVRSALHARQTRRWDNLAG